MPCFQLRNESHRDPTTSAPLAMDERYPNQNGIQNTWVPPIHIFFYLWENLPKNERSVTSQLILLKKDR